MEWSWSLRGIVGRVCGQCIYSMLSYIEEMGKIWVCVYFLYVSKKQWEDKSKAIIMLLIRGEEETGVKGAGMKFKTYLIVPCLEFRTM